MTTLTDNTIIASNSTAAQFRAWAQFIDAAFKLGFVQTADSGQVDLATVAAPSSSNVSMGYRVYRTNDALTPLFFRVEYGSGSISTYPGIWLTIGTGTNGAGTISGTVLLTRTQIANANSDTSTQHLCFASGANNRLTLAMFLNTSAYPLWLSIERRKDANLDDADTGVLVDWGRANNQHSSLCAPFAGVIPTPEIGMQFILTTNNPGAYGNVIPEGLRIPCLGPSEPPGRNVAICNSNDWGQFAEPTLTIAGTDHVFKHCGPHLTTLRGASTGITDSNTRLLLRFE